MFGRKKDKKKEPNQKELDGVQLLAAILVCFPEMGRVTLDAKEGGLWIYFPLGEHVEAERVVRAHELLMDSLRFYHALKGIQGARLAFFYEKRSLRLFRDIDTIDREEMNMLVTLVRENFSDVLVTDPVIFGDEELICSQIEMIDERLNSLRSVKLGKNMVGVREDGRVMVY